MTNFFKKEAKFLLIWVLGIPLSAPRCHRSRETRWAKSQKNVSPQARNASPNSSDATLHPRSPRIVVATDRSLFSTAAAPTRVVSVRRLSVSQSEISPIPFPLCHPRDARGLESH